MAACILFLLPFAFHTAIAQQRQLNISLGSSLSPTGNSSWFSPSGLFAFGFYQQGNGYAVGVFIAAVPNKTAVWTANRDNPLVPSNSTLSLIGGRLILQGVQGEDISVASPTESIAAASMLDSGNFVLYNSAGKITWQSFDNPTNTVLPGQRLREGQRLISSSSETDDSKGIFRLEMQTDGNLVEYPVDKGAPEYAIWASGTSGRGPNVSLNLNNDGFLYLLNSSGTVIRNLTDGGYPTQRTIYFMKINADGIFRLYSQPIDRATSSVIWRSSSDKCRPIGLCGINSFCTDQQDGDADCKCLPGFDFVIQGNWRLGCERRNSKISCKDGNTSGNYRIMTLDNTAWEESSYAELRADAKEDCEKACLDDCNCEAAFFNDGNCKMQRLPLRYGRRSSSESNVALIKVGNTSALDLPPNISVDYPKSITKKKMRVDILIISVSVLGVAVLILAISGVLVHRNRTRKCEQITGSISVEIDNMAPRKFTYTDLQRATDDFKEDVGRGGFGTVYKGILPDSQKVVAVKKLEKASSQGDTEFQNEIRVIGKTHHRNLVQLLGYCLDGPHRLLVYEYMRNGSLDAFLFSSDYCPNWEERIGIASDVARGILYLHEECETQIIHCDIKPQNILLDDQQRAKISDFGISKLLKTDQTRTHTAARGTKGYAAPEWYRKLAVTVKADVYSFGIVLFEIICRRKNVDWSLPENEAILDEWVYTCFEAGELQKLVGVEEIEKRKLERMLRIGLWCTQDDPSLRPSMKKVLLMLEGTVEIPIPPNPTSFLCAVY